MAIQYFTTEVYESFWYDSVRDKLSYNIVIKYCISQAKLPCQSNEENVDLVMLISLILTNSIFKSILLDFTIIPTHVIDILK